MISYLKGSYLRYSFRLVIAFLSRFKALILFSVVMGILFFISLNKLIPIFTGDNTKKIGITGRFTPTTLPVSILQMISDGLTKIGPDGSVTPLLSSGWETTDSGKTWIFKLEKGRTWQDGKPVNSESVSYQFSDVTVENLDDKTISFKLQNPYSAFPSVVSKPTFKKGLLGTGEWEVKKLSLAGAYVDQIKLHNKKGENIIYKFYPSEERTKLAFMMGQVGEIDDIINADPIASWEKLKVIENINYGQYVAVFFNTQDKVLADKNVRQALSYAIDKESHTRAIGPISIESWAYNSQIKPYNYDLDKAKNLLSELPAEVKNGLTINLSTSQILLSTAEKIAKDWQKLGIKVNIQVVSGVPTDYQALLAIFDTPDDPDQYSIWHSTQIATNITHFQNPRIDKLLEDGRTQINIEDRKRTYLDFQRFLLEESPAAFLYYPTTFTIKRR